MHPNGILKDDYIKGLGGQKDGIIISGETLFERAVKVD
jgi:hypothetical protein